ncbi:MAG: hypothetical protein AB2L14_36915 [Candidatus Xenobiia bacterium LiM19]
MASRIGILISHREQCGDFAAFYQRVAESIGIVIAEEIVSAEFGNLKRFFDWAGIQSNGCEERAGAEDQAVPVSVIVHPEVTALSAECDRLRAGLEDALCELQELVTVIVPNLKSLYMLKVGSAEIELLQLRAETARLKRIVEMIQASLNRDEKPDIKAIEEKLDIEMIEWRMEIQRKMEALRKARSRMEMRHMSREEDSAFKSLYRSLVMKLHPDVNPGQTEREKSLWLKLQEAYTRGDIEEMRLVELLLSDCIHPYELSCRSGLDEWRERKSLLERTMSETSAKITAVKSEFPFRIRDMISDAKWSEEQNRKTRLLIQAEIDLKKSLEAHLDAMRRLNPR